MLSFLSFSICLSIVFCQFLDLHVSRNTTDEDLVLANSFSIQNVVPRASIGKDSLLFETTEVTNKFPEKKFKATAFGAGFRPNLHIHRERVLDCEKMDATQMKLIVEEFPAIEIVCEMQQTVLYPTELDGLKPLRYGPFFGLKTYELTEFGIDYIANSSTVEVPLASCVDHTIEKGTGATEVRLAFSLDPGSSIKGGVGLPFPYFGLNSEAGFDFGVTGSIYTSHTCHYDGLGVRPFLSLDMTETAIKVRKWTLGPYNSGFVRKSDWIRQSQPILSRAPPIASCVSEKHVPDVCDLPSDFVEGGRSIRIVGK